MGQVEFVEDSFSQFEGGMVCFLNRQYSFNFLKAVFHKSYLVHSWIPFPI